MFLLVFHFHLKFKSKKKQQPKIITPVHTIAEISIFYSIRHLGRINAEHIEQRTIPTVVEHAIDPITSSINGFVIGSTWLWQWPVAATRFRHGKTTNFCFFWWCESDTTSCIQWSCWRSF